MKVVGIIRPSEVQEIEAEGEDYPAARDALLAQLPEGYTLLHVRRAE